MDTTQFVFLTILAFILGVIVSLLWKKAENTFRKSSRNKTTSDASMKKINECILPGNRGKDIDEIIDNIREEEIVFDMGLDKLFKMGNNK